MTGFHVKAWLAWVGACAIVVLGIDDPITSLVVLMSLALVGLTFAAPGAEGRSVALAFKLGALFIALRLVLFGLTGHDGATLLFTLPRAHLPAWLGGFDLGGRVTGEVLAQQAAEGLKIAAFLVAFGVLLSVVETYRVLRLLPRALFEAGLVVTIALAFVPSMLRRAAEVRDAQRMRGHRFRGVRSLGPLVVPVLADGLERSLTLAESMEARGYGRARTGSARTETRARTIVLAGLLFVAAGGGFMLFGRALPGAPLLAIGALAVARGMSLLSASVERTRFRTERLDGWDRMLVACSAFTIVGAIAARSLGAADWYAYPVLRAPAFDARLIALAVSIVAPVGIAAVRTQRFARASAQNVLPDPHLEPVP